MGRTDEMFGRLFGRLFNRRMDDGKFSLVIGIWACHVELIVVFRIDLVDGQRPTHSRHKGRWLLL
jgi:hypothetical protein